MAYWNEIFENIKEVKDERILKTGYRGIDDQINGLKKNEIIFIHSKSLETSRILGNSIGKNICNYYKNVEFNSEFITKNKNINKENDLILLLEISNKISLNEIYSKIEKIKNEYIENNIYFIICSKILPDVIDNISIILEINEEEENESCCKFKCKTLYPKGKYKKFHLLHIKNELYNMCNEDGSLI